MKRIIVVSFIISAFLLAAVAHAQDVYPVPGQKDMFKGSISVEKYEPYPAAKEDGKIGRLYGYVYGKEKKAENSKKFYVMKDSKITKKGGGAATLNDVKADTVVLVTYKKIASKKKGEEDTLEVTELEIQ
jgi:hypothetical protein